MSLPEVKLEVWLPESKTINLPAEVANALVPNREKEEGFSFNLPRVWKIWLTEESEENIFGDISPYRTAMLPPLPWGNERFYEKKLAVIDDVQVEIYNERIKKMFERCRPELIPGKSIKVGVVEVFRASYNVKLSNVSEESWLLCRRQGVDGVDISNSVHPLHLLGLLRDRPSIVLPLRA